MWFKQAYVFQLTRENYFQQISLEKAVLKNVFIVCEKTQLSSFGFVSALPDTQKLIQGFDNNNYMFLRVQLEEKIIVSDAINRPLKALIAEIEKNEHRKILKCEKEVLKEEIVFQLLPIAQSKYTCTSLYIDVRNGLIVIDTKKRETAESILALLRKSIGLLPVTAFINDDELQEVLQQLLTVPKSVDEKFKVGQETKISGAGCNTKTATFVNQDLYDKNLQAFMCKFDYKIERLKIEFDEKFSFVLHKHGYFSQLQWLDMFELESNEERLENMETDEMTGLFCAEMTLFTCQMSDFFKGLKSIGVVLKVEKKEFELSDID